MAVAVLQVEERRPASRTGGQQDAIAYQHVLVRRKCEGAAAAAEQQQKHGWQQHSRFLRALRGPHAQRFEARVHGRLDRVDTGVGVVGSKYGSKSYSDEYGVPGTVQYQVVR